MENENNTSKNSSVSIKNNFVDEDGELAFYVKNTSQGDVSISDLGITIKMLGVRDLREIFDPEKLKKSPGLREALSPRVQWLKKISREEYERLTTLQSKREIREVEKKKKLSQDAEKKALTNEEGTFNEQKVNVSPKVKSMVEKLRLFYKGLDNSVTPDDFEVFASSTKLNEDERGYILGVVKEPKIRKAISQQTEDEIG